MSVLLINKIITTANDLLHFGDYGDKTAQTTAEKSFTLRNPNNSNIPGWEGQSETVQKTMDVYVLHGYFELGANIDLTGVTFNQYANFTANCGDSDTTASYGFAGVFDGMGYILSGGTYLEGGMFGAIAAGGIVRNVAIMNATLSASDIYYYGYTGSVIGETFAGTLDNVLIEVVGIDSGETVRGRAYGSGIAQAVRGGVITNSIPVLQYDDGRQRARVARGVWPGFLRKLLCICRNAARHTERSRRHVVLCGCRRRRRVCHICGRSRTYRF